MMTRLSPQQRFLRQRQCGSKRWYPDARSAREAANEAEARTGKEYSCYRCPWCSKPNQERWHYGHDHSQDHYENKPVSLRIAVER